MLNERSVFVVGVDNNVRSMFKGRGWNIATRLDEADAFCFTGGADIMPLLYGQRLHRTTNPILERDMMEVALWKSIPVSKPKFGICRGMQLGNVLSGGSMWQDVDNHNGLICHEIKRLDSANDEKIIVNSLHHQMIKPSEDATIIAVADRATYMADAHNTVRRESFGSDELEVEAVFYYHTNFLGVQWHPEYSHEESRKLFFELIDEYIHWDKKKGH